ncbi:c-type cytochrome [uncultured Helicobacter sp.]|uniref:c-type cytochrome n=1 Tax=uncultured Helicobacter sp. TaxID=175537 RepID=UPI00374F9949
MKKIALFCLLATLTPTQTLTEDTPPNPPLTQGQSLASQDAQRIQSQNPDENTLTESKTPDFDNEGFITFKEYGKNLYENPRGIGCNHCHGTKGEGSIIAHYKHKGNAKTLNAPAINKLEFSAFTKALSSQKLNVMPRYYLTPKEIQAIYFYLYE